MSKMKHYVSSKPAYIGGELFPAGRPFVSDTESPSDDWEEITPKAAAVVDSSEQAVPDNADLGALSKTGLQAVAYMRNVAGIADLDNDGLRDAIRASYEAKL